MNPYWFIINHFIRVFVGISSVYIKSFCFVSLVLQRKGIGSSLLEYFIQDNVAYLIAQRDPLIVFR
jgi:hypothetical protein